MLAHHLAITLKTAAGENDGVGGEHLDRAAVRHNQAGDAAVFSRKLLRGCSRNETPRRHASPPASVP